MGGDGFKWPGIRMSAEYGRDFGRKENLGGDEIRTVREGSFILGRPGGRRLQYGVSGGYTRNGKISRNRKFIGARFNPKSSMN